MTITGGCLCGAVRYSTEVEPKFTRHCWCRDCQYIGAGAGTVNVFFPTEAVKIEGALADYASPAASGNLMHRRYCPSCGTPVFTQTEARLHFIGVRAGTLDDPEIAKPQMTIWTSSAPRWAAFEEGIPHEPKQAPPPKRET
ncbi:MAG TPA: GFA family protein [Methyloceanibacter sp.]|nr:GFA family protein [Methyloceanibacter sp.]